MKIREVVLTKNEPAVNDYRELTFKDFILIQNAAQKVANNIGYPVYLVGSAQYKHLPRDIDLSIIIPSDEFIELGKIGPYEITNMEYQPAEMMSNAFHMSFKLIEPLSRLIFDGYSIDLKLCPDNWWTEKPKMLLAKPLRKKKKYIGYEVKGYYHTDYGEQIGETYAELRQYVVDNYGISVILCIGNKIDIRRSKNEKIMELAY